MFGFVQHTNLFLITLFFYFSLFLHQLKEECSGTEQTPLFGGILQDEAFVASKLPITYNPQVSLFDTKVCISCQHFLLAVMYVQLRIYAFLVARIQD